MHTVSYFCQVSILIVIMLSAAVTSAFSQSSSEVSYTTWVVDSLKRMQSVKVGMSRSDLLEVFKEEGGLSTRTWRRYVYRECPYIKVDVEFEPVEAKEDKTTEYASDKIVSISNPYLEWSIID